MAGVSASAIDDTGEAGKLVRHEISRNVSEYLGIHIKATDKQFGVQLDRGV